MRPQAEFLHVKELIAAGLNDCAISRATGIPRGTVREWRVRRPPRRLQDESCPICSAGPLDGWWYAYLLGIYLGDGCLSECARRVFRLRVTLDMRYPAVIDETRRSISAVRPARSMSVGLVHMVGCVQVSAYWKHWPCLFPQHGTGRKHLRRIVLTDWQAEIVAIFPDRLLRGLIQSDGCRSLNRVNGTDYPRYLFTNNSEDIRGIFCRACDLLAVAWRQSNWKTISVARAPDVAKLDLIIGPKTQPAQVRPDKLDRASRGGETVYAMPSKGIGLRPVRVRIPPPAQRVN